jgi:hypothetical protein
MPQKSVEKNSGTIKMNFNSTDESEEYNFGIGKLLEEGLVSCAKIIYPYVTSTKYIKIDNIVKALFRKLRIQHKTETYENILRYYHQVFLFLTDINLLDDNINIIMLCDISTHDYKKYGNLLLYQEIINLMIRMGAKYSVNDICERCLRKRKCGSILLLNDIGLLSVESLTNNISDYEISSYCEDVLDVFMKYGVLTNEHINKLFCKHMYASYFERIDHTLDEFLKFVEKNNYKLYITGNIINAVHSASTLTKIFNTPHEIHMDIPVWAQTFEIYELLQARGFDLVNVECPPSEQSRCGDFIVGEEIGYEIVPNDSADEFI